MQGMGVQPGDVERSEEVASNNPLNGAAYRRPLVVMQATETKALGEIELGWISKKTKSPEHMAQRVCCYHRVIRSNCFS